MTSLGGSWLMLGALALGILWVGRGSLGRDDHLAALMALANTQGLVVTEVKVQIKKIQSAEHLAIGGALPASALQLYRFEGRIAGVQALEGTLLGRAGHPPHTLQIQAQVVQAMGFTAQGAPVLLGQAIEVNPPFQRYGFIGHHPGSSPVAFIEQAALEQGVYLRDTQVLRFDLGPAHPVEAWIGL